MIRMPWNNQSAPNLVIELTDACNIRCHACYKRRGNGCRPLEGIERDLDDAVGLRPLHTVTLSGGEPTLHPELCRIVRMVHERGLHVFLCTNGVRVDGELLRSLRAAGLDSILFHVDTGQQRPDLPAQPGFEDVRKRLDQLCAMAAEASLDVSFSAMLRGEDRDLLRQYTEYFLNAPDASFMFLSRSVDLKALYACEPNPGGPPDMQRLADVYREEFGIEPFAFVPANRGDEHVWVSYFVPVICNGTRRALYRYRSNRMDVWTMQLVRLLTGRFIHKTVQNPRLTLFRMVLNAASGLHWGELARFVRAWRRSGGQLRNKVIVYDDGPHHGPDGAVIRCEYCTTAIVRDGDMRPCCTADYHEQGEAPL